MTVAAGAFGARASPAMTPSKPALDPRCGALGREQDDVAARREPCDLGTHARPRGARVLADVREAPGRPRPSRR